MASSVVGTTRPAGRGGVDRGQDLRRRRAGRDVDRGAAVDGERAGVDDGGCEHSSAGNLCGCIRRQRGADAGDLRGRRRAGERIGEKFAGLSSSEPGTSVSCAVGERIAREVGAVFDLRGRLRGQEVVLELQQLRHAADQVAGGRIDRNAHQVVAGAVDQIAVLVGLEVAAAGVEVDAVEDRPVVDEARRLLDHEEAVAVDRHEGADRGALDVALHRVGGARIGDHVAGELLGRRVVRDQIDEAGVDALEGGGLRVGDVAGDVFERERLRAHTRHRGGECAENTHDIVSNCVPGGRPEGSRQIGRNIAISVASPVPERISRIISMMLEWKTGAGAPSGQDRLPPAKIAGSRGRSQDGFAGAVRPA